MEQRPYWKPSAAQEATAFMEQKVSLPCSQQPAICPQSEPNESSPHNIPFKSILKLFSHLCLRFLSGLSISNLTPTFSINFLSLPYVLHARQSYR